MQAVSLGQDGFNLLGRGDQRFAACLRVAAIGILHGHPDDRARLQIDGMLGLVGEACLPGRQSAASLELQPTSTPGSRAAVVCPSPSATV